jgi:hypothetical protein
MSETQIRPPGPPDAQTIHASAEGRTGFRTGGSRHELQAELGLLREFAGNWRGHGFNLVARPHFKADPPFFLELNETRETLDFTDITGAVPNRGSTQADILLHGSRYVQQVLDVETDTGIHIETGMWMRVPDPDGNVLLPGQAPRDVYVRQSTIPHGDALLAQSIFASEVPGGPTILPVNTLPFTDTAPVKLNDKPTETLPATPYLDQYRNPVLAPQFLPKGVTAAQVVADPTLLLRAVTDRQKINKTIVLAVSTAGPGSLVNIPFVQKNANATSLDAIFWVEWVELENGRVFLQMQYVQRVILDFLQADGKTIHWPHVSVATLKRV